MAAQFTVGMVDTKTAGFFLPRYFRCETRMKVPHGQGLWPAFWFTARNGGASEAEYDGFEYFHAARPGRAHIGLWGVDNTGGGFAHKHENNTGSPNRLYFEAPTYTPAWHTWAWEVVPVTDAGGATTASPTSPSLFVKFTAFLDGSAAYSFVDTTALHWSTNGGGWNIYIQGSQLAGTWAAHPDDALGWSRWNSSGVADGTGMCLISGTAPGSCATAYNSVSVIRAGASGSTATLGTSASTFEIDYVRAWGFTG
jgi:hypothetical protein